MTKSSILFRLVLCYILCFFVTFENGVVLVSADSSKGVFQPGKRQVRVVALTRDNFNTAIEDPANPFWLLKFYAPWCGHCKTLAPILEVVATKTMNVMSIGSIDCTVEKKICSKYDVRGYPTLKYSLDGVLDDFPGGRDEQTFVKFADKMTRPVINFLSSSDTITISNFLKKSDNGVGFIAYHPNGKEVNAQELASAPSSPAAELAVQEIWQSQKYLQLYNTIARAKRVDSYFGLWPASAVITSFLRLEEGQKQRPCIIRLEENVKPKVFYFEDFDEKKEPTDNEEDDENNTLKNEIRHFISNNNSPLVSILGSHNFGKLSRRGRSLVIGVVDDLENNTEEEQLVKNTLVKYAEDENNEHQIHVTQKYFFCIIDGKRWDKFLEKFDMFSNHLPSIFVLDAPAQKYYTEQKYYHPFKNINEGEENAEVEIIPRADENGNKILLSNDDMYDALSRFLQDIDNGTIESKFSINGGKGSFAYYMHLLKQNPLIAMILITVVVSLVAFLFWTCISDVDDLKDILREEEEARAILEENKKPKKEGDIVYSNDITSIGAATITAETEDKEPKKEK